MPVDQDRYQSLIARAAFRAEYFRGTIQDLSSAQRAMAFVGAPSFGKLNGWPCLRQNAAADGTTSGVVAPALDTTQALSFEVVMTQEIAGYTIVANQQPGNGGWSFSYDQPNNRLAVVLYDAAGALARGSYPVGVFGRAPASYIVSFAAGGLTPLAWFRGIPVASAAFGAGVPAVGGNAAIRIASNLGVNRLLIVRAYPFALTSEDAARLAEQAKLLVGGW